MRKPLIGQRVTTRNGRICRVVSVYRFQLDGIYSVHVVDVHTGEDWAMTVEFLVGFGEDHPNWLHEGF